MLQAPNGSAVDGGLVDFCRKEVLKLFGAFATCMQHRGPSEHLLRLALRGLHNYARAQFADEQVLMHSAGVDRRHVAKHQMEHRSFMYDLDQCAEQLDVVTAEGVNRVSVRVLRMMSNWLLHHVLGTDQVMVAQIAAIRHGILADAAFVLHPSPRPVAHPSPESEAQATAASDAHCRRLAEKLDALASHLKAVGAEWSRMAA